MSVRKLLFCCICNKCPGFTESSSSASNDNKRSLKSGNELIDWIRLGNSGVDLTGVGGRVRIVCPAELKKHCTKDDAWLAIRGRVYNITHYLPYHPGGAEELMRGAGRDATELFDKIHPWINYDSLLVKCLVGNLRSDTPDNDIFFDASDSFPESDLLISSSKAGVQITNRNYITNFTTPPKKKIPYLQAENSQNSRKIKSLKQDEALFPGFLGTLHVLKREAYAEDVPPAIFFDWEQTLTKLTVAIYTGPMSNPSTYSQIAERNLLIKVTVNGWIRTIKLITEDSLLESLHTSIIAHKAESKIWKCCGEVTIGPASKDFSPQIMSFKVVDNKKLTHDTRLLTITPCFGTVIIPIGHHIRIHQTIAGSEYIRSYTPVSNYWIDSKSHNNTYLHLAIKRYDNGILSPMLTTLSFKDDLKVSGPHGTFALHKLKLIKTILLLAAGSGITPMLGVIKFMLSRTNPLCERVQLLFFNKTEKDIMFQEGFEELANRDQRFTVVHILSNASSTWTGCKGRINIELISAVLIGGSMTYEEDSLFICVCGPTEFSYAALKILKNLRIGESSIYVFTG
ncbi:unnamed protein product [Parnassius apollo]|uniref:(apollo) hypothetical protein n=1 Tax=Parnassius apollo TaxID=110799 RepID=A0A8S3WDW6_PARAO|nr:unnamed protein product [Parnassius apollo]